MSAVSRAGLTLAAVLMLSLMPVGAAFAAVPDGHDDQGNHGHCKEGTIPGWVGEDGYGASCSSGVVPVPVPVSAPTPAPVPIPVPAPIVPPGVVPPVVPVEVPVSNVPSHVPASEVPAAVSPSNVVAVEPTPSAPVIIPVDAPISHAQTIQQEGDTLIDWNAIVWFIIWSAAIFIGLSMVVWIIVASIAAFVAKSVKDDFDKGFESDFFKRNRP